MAEEKLTNPKLSQDLGSDQLEETKPQGVEPEGDKSGGAKSEETTPQVTDSQVPDGIDPRFANPKKMGFMRLIMLVQILGILLTASSLVFISKNTVVFGFSDYWLLINMVFSALGFWLLWKRKSAARPVLIIFSALNLIESFGLTAATGGISLDNIDLTFVWDIIVMIYMATSRRAKAILTQPFQEIRATGERPVRTNYYRPNTWAFWRNLIIYFCIFSIVGHWMEAAYCLLIKYGILPGIYDPTSQIWSDWLYPFPVYGFGAVACVLLLYPVKLVLQKHIKNPVLPLIISFVFNGCVCCLIELIMGLMTNMDYSLWDYRDMFCNFMGQICLQNGIAFGAVATLMTWVIYPALEFVIGLAPRSTMTVIFIVVVVFFAILWSFYLVNVPLPDVSEFLEENLGLVPVDELPDGEFGISIETREWGR